jgi:GNAT superfamily N-acetyltransferase
MTPDAPLAPLVRLEFFTDPEDFLGVAGDHLAADPVTNTVVTSVTDRAIAKRRSAIALPERDWWVVVRDGVGEVIGVAMRTAPFAPYPPYLLPMPATAAVALARALHERGESVTSVNGALPAIEAFAAELARLTGGRVECALHTRLFVLTELHPPAPARGSLRRATASELDLVMEWMLAFSGDADEQAGRERGSAHNDTPERDDILRRLEAGWIWFWVDETGRPVHMTAANPPSYGVARVGPVYTPPAERGRGWAAQAVAGVSRHLIDLGALAALFTDQANPTSNKLYLSLGYRPVVDMANLVILT